MLVNHNTYFMTLIWQLKKIKWIKNQESTSNDSPLIKKVKASRRYWSTPNKPLRRGPWTGSCRVMVCLRAFLFCEPMRGPPSELPDSPGDKDPPATRRVPWEGLCCWVTDEVEEEEDGVGETASPSDVFPTVPPLLVLVTPPAVGQLVTVVVAVDVADAEGGGSDVESACAATRLLLLTTPKVASGREKVIFRYLWVGRYYSYMTG